MSGSARTNILTEREGFPINKASNYEKRSALKCCNCNTLHIQLYINRNFALPSLCEASHKDGWGEGFEQRPRATGDGDLYVHFWQSKGFFLKTKQELEHTHQLTPKEQYNQIAPLADPDGFQLYWTARTLTGIDVPSSFHYEDNRGMFEAASGHTLLRYLTALHFDAVQWEIVGGGYERAVLGTVDTATPEYKAFEQKLYSAVMERISRKRNVPHKSTQNKEEGMTR